VISSANRDEYRPVWEMIYNHYANRVGLLVPNIAALAQRMRPESGPNTSYPSTFETECRSSTSTSPGANADATFTEGAP
jgi:hypothetical protein